MSDYLRAMQALEDEFRASSGLADRRFYKIQYSHLHPFPLLALGDNPGGVPEGGALLESSTFYEKGQHDLVEYRANTGYPIAAGMYALLAGVLGTRDPDAVRRVPYLNVTFRRSQKKAALDVSAGQAARESAPVLAKIIRLVDPGYLVVTRGGFEQFRGLHLGDACRLGDDTITTPNGSNTATVFEAFRGTLQATGKPVVIAVIGHPSKYARRVDTWAAVAKATREVLHREGLVEALAEWGKRERA